MKLIYIEWADAVSNTTDWKTEDELEEWLDGSEWIIKQVGWILKETKGFILLVGKYKPDDNFCPAQYSHIIKIPKTWIRKRKIIKL